MHMQSAAAAVILLLLCVCLYTQGAAVEEENPDFKEAVQSGGAARPWSKEYQWKKQGSARLSVHVV